LLNGQSHLAVDFNLPSNTTQILYYSGQPKIWKSNGIIYDSILGAERRVFTMTSDTVYDLGPRRYEISWTVKISEDIGPYYYYKNQWDSDLQYEWERKITKNTLVFAKIDTNEINVYNTGIELLEPVRNRFVNEFPYLLPLNVINPITGVISEFYAEYNVFRHDTLVFNKVFDIDTSTFLGYINIQPEELQEDDKVKFKCILEDTSIFNNFRFIPDSGYYTFYILSDTTTSLENKKENIIEFSLSQNYPNPFNPTTCIQYAIGSMQYVTLKVYDVLGNEVASLVNEEKPSGSYSVEFNGSNLPAGKAGLSSGIYFYKLNAGNFVQTRKMILLK
jgi:hypothetical protein